jgi:hypothetical protein
VVQSLLNLEFSRSHTMTHPNGYDSSARTISSSQRLLPDNTQQLQHTYLHATGGIRTHNFSRRSAADLRLNARTLGPAYQIVPHPNFMTSYCIFNQYLPYFYIFQQASERRPTPQTARPLERPIR